MLPNFLNSVILYLYLVLQKNCYSRFFEKKSKEFQKNETFFFTILRNRHYSNHNRNIHTFKSKMQILQYSEKAFAAICFKNYLNKNVIQS